MGQHVLTSGRVVSLVRFTMVGTYSGIMEGSLEAASQRVRETITEQAADLLPPCRPLVVIDPPLGELPQWICVAHLDSRSGVRHNDADYNSRLYACWFMDDTTQSLDAVLDSVVARIDWDGVAEDYDMMDF